VFIPFPFLRRDACRRRRVPAEQLRPCDAANAKEAPVNGRHDAPKRPPAEPSGADPDSTGVAAVSDMALIRLLVRWLLRLFYRVRVVGLEHYEAAGPRALIVANHASFLDPPLLVAFLPDPLTFAINTQIARLWWVRPVLRIVDCLPLDPTKPQSLRSLIRCLRTNRRTVVFPEGRITVTGGLMKIYAGPALVADRAGAAVLPVRIDGAQYTPFSRLRGRVRLRWFPPITVTFLPPRRLEAPADSRGRVRRKVVGQQLADLMTELMFRTANYRRTLAGALLEARRVHGGRHEIAEDIDRRPVTYARLLSRGWTLGGLMARGTRRGEVIGVLMPGSVATLYALVGLHARGRVPAMLDYTEDATALRAACTAARIGCVVTSRTFIAAARLGKLIDALQEHYRIVYLEDLRDRVGPLNRLAGHARLLAARLVSRRGEDARADEPAAVLFVNGADGKPRGVVLSHANLLANAAQAAARVDFGAQDVIFNALPLYTAIGLTTGTLLGLVSGVKVFLYPSALHFRIVPEMAYAVNATILFGTNTFLAGYARYAHPYDFFSVRYVFAGGEPVRAYTRQRWAERFGLRIFEGFGATEAAPLISTNTPMDDRAGTLGRLMPGIEHRLIPVSGISVGGRLAIRGPNLMLGYLTSERPDEILPPACEAGPGWFDTGELMAVDGEDYLRRIGERRHMARVGARWVSLEEVEALAAELWPDGAHHALALPDFRQGECVVLVTTWADASLEAYLARARAKTRDPSSDPVHIITLDMLPRLADGTIDEGEVCRRIESRLPALMQGYA
jgi:acyl-[acyl-carrier-protein]-phospholipid O-acyltransferase/long-chain-fatty-acid--[acyl-carrier-protein] ligase